jgi:hypothetical protein
LEDQLSSEAWRSLKLLLALIEQSLPVEHIAQLRSEEARSFSSRIDVTVLRELIVQLIDDYRRAGQTDDQILHTLQNTQPFDQFPDIIEEEIERDRLTDPEVN